MVHLGLYWWCNLGVTSRSRMYNPDEIVYSYSDYPAKDIGKTSTANTYFPNVSGHAKVCEKVIFCV